MCAFVLNEFVRLQFFNNAVIRKHGFAISRRLRPRFALTSPSEESEGAGNAGRSMRPQPRV
jgi:hypothetical protein